MVARYSSRRQHLDKSFLCEKLKDAESYDRIAGYFCSSILEVAGEEIENIKGKVRIICNSNLSPEDVKVASLAQKMKQEWCATLPEELYTTIESSKRLERLYNLIKSGKLEVRVIPNEIYGLMHGKAGIITYPDGRKTTFIGSINETKSAFMLNYEMIWEDDSDEAVKWVQEEFDFFWHNEYAVNLCDFVVEDINRIAKRTKLSLKVWRDETDEKEIIPAAAVEDPIYRKEFGLWEHQKYFVELAFREHKTKGGARFILADQVGLGKTVQLAMSAKLMALYGDKPILIIVPKTLIWQWQEEMQNLLDMPSAVWTGKGWQDENGYLYPSIGPLSIKKCPRKIGIISQGLVARRSEVSEYLKQMNFECVILDEAHRARRRNANKNPDTHKADPNILLDFINEISFRTKSMLLGTATPVQINTIEVFDLINALSKGTDTEKIMGNEFSKWHKEPQTMLDMVCGKKPCPTDENFIKSVMLNPFPTRTTDTGNLINRIRQSLHLSDDQVIIQPSDYQKMRKPDKDKFIRLYAKGEFIEKYNPYIRHIVRRTRSFLEETINPETQKPYLDKIEVILYGEDDDSALTLEGYQKQAYQQAKDFCHLLSQRTKAGGFMSTLMLKRIGSTIIAGQLTAMKMLAWTQTGKNVLSAEYDVVFEEDDEDVEASTDNTEIKKLTNDEIECLKKLVKYLEMNKNTDPKYRRILEILNNGIGYGDSGWKQQGCIIFSQYYDSARYVAEKLSLDLRDTQIGLYAGGEKSGFYKNGVFVKETKDKIKTAVRLRSIKILVGTDAASEGLNLQTLSTLINLDLPWNPTRLEQRKGRIQRIGQDSSKIKIFNMRYKDSVEDKVHSALSARLSDIHGLFGQIPDTLEDVWIDIALDNIEKAKERINAIPITNPFINKYENLIQRPNTEDWALCKNVLDKADIKKELLKGWDK